MKRDLSLSSSSTCFVSASLVLLQPHLLRLSTSKGVTFCYSLSSSSMWSRSAFLDKQTTVKRQYFCSCPRNLPLYFYKPKKWAGVHLFTITFTESLHFQLLLYRTRTLISVFSTAQALYFLIEGEDFGINPTFELLCTFEFAWKNQTIYATFVNHYSLWLINRTSVANRDGGFIFIKNVSR